MANTKVTALTELTSIASTDVAYVVDVSDTTDGANGTSKKITVANLTALKAAVGANSDITSLTGLTTPLTVAQGGTGAATLTGILKGSGTSAFTAVTAPSGTIVGTTDSQTLTNKTLTAPIISSISNTGTLTLPTSTDTLVGRDTTDTLTNKTLTAPKIADQGFIADANGNEMILFDTITTAVDYITFNNSATGSGPGIMSAGESASPDLYLSSKGSGSVYILANSQSDTIAVFEAAGDVDLAVTTANIQVGGSDPKRTMYVPASAMYPSTTAGCATLSQVESSTNDVNIKTLAFDGAGTDKKYAEFGIQSPTYWDASTITVQFVWYAAAGSGTVNWEAQGLALSDDDALDTAYGTLQEVTDTLLAIGDVHITAETSAITVAGSPVAGDWLQIKIARDPANDTDTSDALLMGVRIRFGIKQYNDA